MKASAKNCLLAGFLNGLNGGAGGSRVSGASTFFDTLPGGLSQSTVLPVFHYQSSNSSIETINPNP